MRISEAQKALLTEIVETDTDDGKGLYIRVMSVYERTVRALQRRGLVEVGYHIYGQNTNFWRATDQGRAVNREL